MRCIRRSKQAFTLIEILVALVILAILAALLVPIMARSREVPRERNCRGNLRYIGLACLQYAEDHGDAMPFVENGKPWMTELGKYVKSPDIFRCPDDEAADHVPSGAVYSSYGVNAAGWGEPLGSPFAGPLSETRGRLRVIRLAEINHPATTFLAGDSLGPNNFAGYYRTAKRSEIGLIHPDTSGDKFGIWTARHSDSISLLWCDGHVQTTSLGLLATAGEGRGRDYYQFFTIGADPN